MNHLSTRAEANAADVHTLKKIHYGRGENVAQEKLRLKSFYRNGFMEVSVPGSMPPLVVGFLWGTVNPIWKMCSWEE